jgi:hypothetical protein
MALLKLRDSLKLETIPEGLEFSRPEMARRALVGHPEGIATVALFHASSEANVSAVLLTLAIYSRPSRRR